MNRLYLGILTIGLLLLNTTVVDAADEDQLRKAAQNPVASMISLPFQNNTLFGVGPDDDTANVLNIQPVIPFKLNEDWNLISRTIVPLLYVPDLVSGLPELPAGISGGDTFGMGDINTTLFVSPAKRGMAIWGFGLHSIYRPRQMRYLEHVSGVPDHQLSFSSCQSRGCSERWRDSSCRLPGMTIAVMSVNF